MQSKIRIPTWRKHPKEVSNTREHPKTPFRLAKPNLLLSKGNFNGMVEEWKVKMMQLLMMLICTI